jgi:L-threonylcarbamoyladenylate synthase
MDVVMPMSLYSRTFWNHPLTPIVPISILRVDLDERRMPRRAIELIRNGGLVAYPTDTVYGLGTSIFQEGGVRRIFEVKGRPPSDPLPILIADVAQVEELAAVVPSVARDLMRRFWPGPLTIVLPRSSRVPEVVSGGGPSIALRMPNHPIPLRLIQEAGVPIVGTSANSHGAPSPITATQVATDIGDRIDLILDGGRTPHGIPSTVVDLTGAAPRVVRAGALDPALLREVLGEVLVTGRV